jgi:hypothetical protein
MRKKTMPVRVVVTCPGCDRVYAPRTYEELWVTRDGRQSACSLVTCPTCGRQVVVALGERAASDLEALFGSGEGR